MEALILTGRKNAVWLWIMALMIIGSGTASAASVRAYVQPPTARPHQVVTYVITVQNGTVNSVPNLRFPLQIGQNSAVSTSQQYQIINGRQSASMQLSWGISASEPGEFIIPPQDVVVDGQVMKTNEVKLTVTQGGAPGTPGAAGTADEADASGPLLQIEVGKKEFYQGEVVPITASLYVPRQTPLRRLGLIDIEKNDFAIARFPQQSEQTITDIAGIGYYVLTFRSTLSSLRTGDLTVGPATTEVLVEVPMRGARSLGNLPPGFPQMFFGGQTEPRKLTVTSQTVPVKVLPLPAEGRPESFSGAVGDFRISSTASPVDLAVGDPISVELVIEGSGNFDALTTPALTRQEGWKPYPAKRYVIEGQIDQNQMPTLERKIGWSLVLVPEKLHTELPPFELSFFSPSQKKYITLRTDPIALKMRPGAAPAAAADGGATGVTSEITPAPVVLSPQPDITDIVVRPPTQAQWIAPHTVMLIKAPGFWTVQAVPVALFVLACAGALIRRRSESLRAGKAGELRAAWEDLQDGGLDDATFLHRAAQFIHSVQSGAPVTDPPLQHILHCYETRNFSAPEAAASPLPPAERQQMMRDLSALLHRALESSRPAASPAVARGALAAVIALVLLTPGLHAQTAPAARAATPDDIYRDAVTELEKGSFTRAQYLAESLTKRKPPVLSPEAFEIVGHARYRQGDLGRAALWYQRAQLFSPRSPELRQNLRHLYDKTRFLSFANPSPLALVSLWFSMDEWTLAAVTGGWLLFLALTVRVLLRGTRHPRLCGWIVALAIGGLLVTIPASAFAALRPSAQQRVQGIHIVTLPDIRSFTAATVTSGTVIDLPPGSQVRILEERGAWTYVEIPNSPEALRGWLENAALTPLWPWDPALIP